MSTILKFDFQKRKQLRFSEVNYLNYTKKSLNFACGTYIFPKTRGNKNKPWTHSTPLNLFLCNPAREAKQHVTNHKLLVAIKHKTNFTGNV